MVFLWPLPQPLDINGLDELYAMPGFVAILAFLRVNEQQPTLILISFKRILSNIFHFEIVSTIFVCRHVTKKKKCRRKYTR